jgi:hypothetical protein
LGPESSLSVSLLCTVARHTLKGKVAKINSDNPTPLDNY